MIFPNQETRGCEASPSRMRERGENVKNFKSLVVPQCEFLVHKHVKDAKGRCNGDTKVARDNSLGMVTYSG
jgi:hypothetical protein